MGCQQSVPEKSRREVFTVGGTERMASRAARLQTANTAAALSNNGTRTSNVSASMVNHSYGNGNGNGNISPASAIRKQNPPKLDAVGHLLPEEVVRRTSCAIKTKEVLLGMPDNPIQVEYAHWTQRGYYPDDPHKENQDELSVSLQFAGSEQDAMFAVYDGHGKSGHACARFAKNKLPRLVAKHLRAARVKKYKDYVKIHDIKGAKLFDPANWPYLTAEEYKAVCRKAFLECNKVMHDTESVEDKMSGTTAISVNFHGNIVAISNVGDSRAVLGHRISSSTGDNTSSAEEKAEIDDGEDNNVQMSKASASANPLSNNFPTDGKILAIPLSRDQTPYRKDERERVKRLGAAIMSIDQMEGHEEMHENWGDMVLGQDVDIHGDPPRVWMEGKDYPGTAFTRSIGDNLAEDVGVTAEPEMLARELTSNDHILVVASDGIFEFLTNQEVIDVCVECESPLQACQKLVKMAYDQWLVYENRTDDITVIVCFMNCNKPPPIDGAEGTTEDLVVLAKSIYGNKPVRKKPRNKNDNLMTASTVPFAVAVAELEQNGLHKVRFDEETYNENESKS